MSRSRNVRCGVLLISLLTACRQSDGTIATRRYDSLGISILRVIPEDGAVPATDIAGDWGHRVQVSEESTNLYLVEAAHRLQNGTVALADAGNSQILLFDSVGRLIQKLGARGKGPGEFSRLTGIFPIGVDTIVALDTQLRRLSFYDHDRHYVGSTDIDPPHAAASMGLSALVGSIGEDLLVWMQAMPSGEELRRLNTPHQIVQAPVVLFAVGLDGKTRMVFGTFPGEEVYLGSLPGTDIAANWGAAPFGKWVHFGSAGGVLYACSNENGELRQLDRNGTLRKLIRFEVRKRTVTKQLRARMIEERSTPGPPELFHQRVATWQNAEFPKFMPTLRECSIGRDGTIWVEFYRDWEKSQRVLYGYDTAGHFLRRVKLQHRDRPLELSQHDMLLLQFDSNDVPSFKFGRF